MAQSCKSCRVFRFGFGLKFEQHFILISSQAQENIKTLRKNVNFSTFCNNWKGICFQRQTQVSFFFWSDFGFETNSGSGSHFRVQAGFGPAKVGPFTTLLWHSLHISSILSENTSYTSKNKIIPLLKFYGITFHLSNNLIKIIYLNNNMIFKI